MEYMGHIPFAQHLGLKLVAFENGHSEVAYEALPEHLNNFGVTHGGACMTLLDVAMASAARSARHDSTVITIEMKTSFMQPAQGPLRAKGRLVHGTTKMAFAEATIYDAQERPCAHATGTFKYVLPRADRKPD